MFGRTVTIDGTDIFVCCCPDTPYSEILERAAIQLRREEQETKAANQYSRMYREALR